MTIRTGTVLAFMTLMLTLPRLTGLKTCAQTLTEIQTSGNYYWGEGEGETTELADNEAFRRLLTSISSDVVVDVENRNTRKEANGHLVSDNSLFKSAVKTYSYGHLTDVRMFVISKPPKAHVVRWIRRSDVDRIFDGRRNKIFSMIDNADNAKALGKVDVALRNYYWAYCLLKTLRNPSEEVYGGELLSTWLPEQIEEILDDVRVAVDSRRDYDVDLYFTYKGKPVTSLEFTYNDMGHESTYAAKDGMGQIELTGSSDTTLYNLNIEYAFRNQSKLDPEVDAVMRLVPDDCGFTRSAITVRPGHGFNRAQASGYARTQNSARAVPQQQRESFSMFPDTKASRPEAIPDGPASDRYNRVMSEIVKSIRRRSYGIDAAMFTGDGYSQFQKLVRDGKARIVGTPQFVYTEFEGLTMARGMQMSFAFKNGVHRNFTEDVVFTFNPEGRICNLSFGLGKTVEDNIMCMADVPERSRKYLCMFLENYQTAYALKDLDYISRIFDDYAKIITVTEMTVKRRNVDGGFRMVREQRENRFDNKYDFLEHLDRGFRSKEYIRLRFNSVMIDRADDGRDIYGIQLEQDYYSSNYCDHGYLLIGLNYENMDSPKIFVRTWQSEPDPNFGLYRLPHFYKDGKVHVKSVD